MDKKWYGLLWEYGRSYWRFGAALGLFAAIFAAVIFLYDVPAEAAVYAAALCALAGALLLVFLEKGAIEIASKFKLTDYASDVVKGIILFFLLGSEFFIQYSVRLRHSHKKEVQA